MKPQLDWYHCLLPPGGLWESAPSMSESPPTPRPVSGGTDLRTDELCEARWHFADASVGALPHAGYNCDGRFRAAESAGWRSILRTPVCEFNTHTHIQQPTLCLSCQRSSNPRTGINGRKKSHCVARQHFFFLCVQQVIPVSSSHHSVFKSSSVPPRPQNCINILWSQLSSNSMQFNQV